jgi:acylpyruvate hydrolase
MRLTTIRLGRGTRAARVEDDALVLLDAPDAATAVAAGVAAGAGRRAATPFSDADLAPLVPSPRKIICLGLNYEGHIAELGRTAPDVPTLFSKFAVSLIGPHDDIVLPRESEQVDWEAELALVIGRTARRVDAAEGLDVIAGYTVCNDVSARDWQWRTSQWLAGKTFDRTTPLGPVLVTGDEIDHAADLAITCRVDGEVRQSARTSELVFGPGEIVAHLSRIMTLEPGDVVSTGTPAGVGAGRDPQVWLEPGQIVRTAVEGIGELVNHCVAET